MENQSVYASFCDRRLIATGALGDVLSAIKGWSDGHPGEVILVFEERTGRQVDFDLRGTVEDVLARAIPSPEPSPSGPGRPKLGVVAREVTLLPRHWDWLEQQPSGASAALRRLVDQARKLQDSENSSRRAADATCRFLSAMAGGLPGYEEATRALYAGDQAAFSGWIASWPEDIRTYTLHMASPVFEMKTSDVDSSAPKELR